MIIATRRSESLFAYGTLLDIDVQLSVFNRRLDGRPDGLSGFRMTAIVQDGQHYPNIARSGVDRVGGQVFEVTPHELRLADAYEGAPYERVRVLLESAHTAWVYIAP